ncbi:MAG TPA: MBL fold metallo-hydrolase [Myxococcota bacterium]
MALIALASAACGHVAFEDVERWNAAAYPSPPERAVDARVTGVCAAGSLNWIVPVGGDQVVLVDAGFQESGAILKEAIGSRRLLAVLLTHAHPDHTAAARALGVPVFLGSDDVPLLERRYVFSAVVPWLFAFAAAAPPPSADIHGVRDGDVVALGDRRFTAIAMPGHTPGSTAWLVDDMVFTGDAAMAPLGADVWPAPWYVTESEDDAYRSLAHLATFDFATLFDAHFGKLEHAHDAVVAAVRRRPRTEQPSDRPHACAER